MTSGNADETGTRNRPKTARPLAFPLAMALWWACQDLNLGPHPYQWSWARWPTPAHENGSAVGPLGRPLLRGGGERRVDRISDLRVCRGHGSFSTQQSTGNRCAEDRFCRSHSTVGAEVTKPFTSKLIL